MVDTADVLVIGGGVFGLSAARSCAAAGLRVILTERAQIGAGASGGLVGALVPHRPGHWRGFEQFQFDALAELPARMVALAQASGCDPGYARTGRLSPLADAGQRVRAEAQVAAACAHWAGDARFDVLEELPEPASDWLAPASFPFGLVRETMSARVVPRQYLAALEAALADRVDIRQGWRCDSLDPAGGVAKFAQGEIAAGHVVLAAGIGAIPLLEQLTARPCGSGVKGQAALLDIEAPPGLPVIQGAGLYLVAHGRSGVAVGSTSEKTWDQPGPDTGLEELIARARALCPALAKAPVIQRWAGIRPRAPGNAPMVGRIEGMERLVVAAGGYKTGLGIAHLIGDAVAAMVRGEAPHHPLPPEFAPQRHFTRSTGGHSGRSG